MNLRIPSAALLLAAAALCGCGKQGDLERPRPMFGTGFQPSAEVITRDDAAARARADGAAYADPIGPQSVDEVRDQGVGAPRGEAAGVPPSEPQ